MYKHVRETNLDVGPEYVPQSMFFYCSVWVIIFDPEDKVDVVSPFSILVRTGVADFVPSWRFDVDVITIFNIGHRGWRVVSLFNILVIGGGGFWSLMMVRWYVLIMKITVFKVSFACHRGLIFPLGLAWIRNFPSTQNCLCYVTMMSLGER